MAVEHPKCGYCKTPLGGEIVKLAPSLRPEMLFNATRMHSEDLLDGTTAFCDTNCANWFLTTRLVAGTMDKEMKS